MEVSLRSVRMPSEAGHQRRWRTASVAAVLLVIVGWVVTAGGPGRGPAPAPDETVESGSGVVAVRLPAFRLPGGAGRTSVVAFSPGRSEQVALRPDGGVAAAGAPITVTVVRTDRSPSGLARSRHGWSGAEQPVVVRGVPGVARPADEGGVSTIQVTWKPTADTGAELSWPVSGPPGAASEAALALAGSLEEAGPAEWRRMLTGSGAEGTAPPSGAGSSDDPGPGPTGWEHLGPPGGRGWVEIERYSPGVSLVDVIELERSPAGHARLTEIPLAGRAAAPPEPRDDPAARSAATVHVRGVDGVFSEAAASGGDVAGGGGGDGVERVLRWNGPDVAYRLAFAAAVTEEQAVRFADALVPVEPSRWSAMLEPSTLRTDLVPLPVEGQ